MKRTKHLLPSPCVAGKNRAAGRRGAAAVEFAVVLPVFITLVFGMIEYGRMVMVQQVITNAAREGCRRAIMDGATSQEVQDVVNNYLESAGITSATITITPSEPSEAGAGEPVTVSVSVPYDQVSWLPAPMYLSGTEMSATCVMRRETVD